MEKETKCTEKAMITLPWGGKLLNYCPVHANEVVILGNAMGSPISAQLLHGSTLECESKTPLTEEEKQVNINFGETAQK